MKVKLIVPIFLFCFSLIFFPTYALEDTVKVTAEIDQDKIYENQPGKGLISITHDKKASVDPSSFRLGGKSLAADLIQDIQISPSSPLVISYYRFYMPGQPAGLYLLPEVKVTVGGHTYTSIPSSYQIEEVKDPNPYFLFPLPSSAPMDSPPP